MPFDKCPQCGFAEPVVNRPFMPGFYAFFRKDTGEKAIMQRDNKTFTIPATENRSEITWLSQEDYDKSKVVVAPAPIVPPKIVPSAPVIPAA